MKITFQETFDLVYRRSQSAVHLDHYAGLLTMYAAARHWVQTRNDPALGAVKARLLPFIDGTAARVHGAYCTYATGGNASAYLYKHGKLPEGRERLIESAEKLMKEHVRDPDGIFAMPNRDRKDMIWIDTVYPVVPYLTWVGLAEKREDMLQEAADQMGKMYQVLLDRSCGLLHQARGFLKSGHLTEDHWGRGNGWAMLGLADVLDVLPQTDPRHADYVQMFRDLSTSAIAHQDQSGMWHQELTDHESYPEVSGTGLMVYGLGVGLRRKILDAALFSEAFSKGLSGLMRYIALDGSIYNCCRGCLAPNQGRMEDYTARGWMVNDHHAFGPVMLALSEAIRQRSSEPDMHFDSEPPDRKRHEFRCIGVL